MYNTPFKQLPTAMKFFTIMSRVKNSTVENPHQIAAKQHYVKATYFLNVFI